MPTASELRSTLARAQATGENPTSQRALEQAVEQAAAEIERLEAERDEATVYARNSLVSFVNRYCDPIAEWAPLPDLIGMLTQIDNAATIAGVFRNRAESAEALCDKLAEALRDVDERFCQFINCYGDPTGDRAYDADEERRNVKALYDAITSAREALEQVGKR